MENDNYKKYIKVQEAIYMGYNLGIYNTYRIRYLQIR